MSMEISADVLIALIGVAIALVGLMLERFYYDAKMSERIAALETDMLTVKSCITTLNETRDDVMAIRTKVDLFWGALETQLPGMLLKGNPLAPDSQVAILLTKFKEGTTSSVELETLTKLLEDEAKNPGHMPGEVLAMVLMSATVKARLESENGHSCCST